MTILIFAAHPDDEVLGAGGTILHFKDAGELVISVIVSYGEMSHPWMKEKYTKEIRKAECNEVKKFMNVDKTVYLGLKEGNYIKELEENESKIKELIIKNKIKKVFTHSPSDPHPDHNACYNFIMKVCEDIDTEILAFDVWNPLIWRKRNYPKIYYDITKYISKKNQALNMYKSQSAALLLMGLKPFMWVRAFLNGLKINKRFAEGFIKLK